MKKLKKDGILDKNEKSDSDDLNDFESEDLVQTKTNTINEYIIYLDDVIDEVQNYRSICKTLRDAKNTDIVRMVMSSHGGYVYTFVQLFNYLINCKAKTICELHTAYSAGSLLALSCDEIEVQTFAGMMIHECSFGSKGKNSDVKEHVAYVDKRWKAISRQLYKGFLTDEEIRTMLKGQDIWLQEKDIKKRLKNWIPIRKRK